MAKTDEPKNLYEVMQKNGDVFTRQLNRERDILFTRQYLRFLENGHTADELIIAQWPPIVEETFAEDGSRQITWTQRCELRLKEDMERYPWAPGCGPGQGNEENGQ